MRRRDGERGSALVEFTLCFALFWCPLFIGLVVVGFGLVRAIQVTQVCRDAGHMFAYGTDFSTPPAQTLIASLGSNLKIHVDGTNGYGVIALSRITYVDQSLCDSGSLGIQPCVNRGSYVLTKRLIIGKSSPMPSGASNPPTLSLDQNGNVSLHDMLTNLAARVANFDPNLFAIPSSSQAAYVSEMWYTSPEFKYWSGSSASTPYARFTF